MATTDAALSYERPAAPGTPAWQNEQAWRLHNATDILGRQKNGGKYEPNVDAGGNITGYPTDNEPTRLIGETQVGAGMSRDDRVALDITVHDKRVDVRAHHPTRKVTITIRTHGPLPAGAP